MPESQVTREISQRWERKIHFIKNSPDEKKQSVTTLKNDVLTYERHCATRAAACA